MITKANSGFTYTTAIRKLRKLRSRTKVVPGGTSAGKTFGILPILIDRAARSEGLEISIVSESVPHLRKGALKDFLKIMKATGRYIDKNYNRTLLTYTFTNGSYIEFFSADQEDKVRGPRRHILYINECNNINFDTYHQLAIRTSLEIWLDFNPSNEFWAYTELETDPDTEWLTLTYRDNEALPDAIIKEIEKALYKAFFDPDLPIEDLFRDSNIKNAYWANWWKVYGLGKKGSLEGVVFNNWDTVASVPKDAELIGYGLDFGFSNDPTALTAVYRYGSKVILDEVIYSTGLLNSDIIRLMRKNGVSEKMDIRADSARPDIIEEIRRGGFRGIKKAESKDINFGIDIMQDQEFLITNRSTNIIKEFRGYCWDRDKTGAFLNKPIDSFNHAIDGIRYLSVSKLNRRRKSFVV